MANRRVPITRISRFFSSQDFTLEQNMGMEWLHGDMHFTLVLFRVDDIKTDIDDIYAEAGPEEIRYKPPVEFKAYVKIAEHQNKSYASGLVNQMEPGNINKVQLSPTVQATKSNYTRVHGGKAIKYLNFFKNPNIINNVITKKITISFKGNFIGKQLILKAL